MADFKILTVSTDYLDFLPNNAEFDADIDENSLDLGLGWGSVDLTIDASFKDSNDMSLGLSDSGDMSLGTKFSEDDTRIKTLGFKDAVISKGEGIDKDYNNLNNKPTINDVVVEGAKSGFEYGLQNRIVPGHNVSIREDGVTIDVEGVGIKSVVVNYGVSDDITMPTDWSVYMPFVREGQYLWTRTVTDYYTEAIDDTVVYSYTKQGEKGESGHDGFSVRVLSIQYQIHSNGTEAPTGSWSDDPIETTSDYPFLWTKTEFSDGSVGYGIAKQGDPGQDGNGIFRTEIMYAANQDGSTEPMSWSSTIPETNKGDWLWVRTSYTYDDGTTRESVSKSYIGTDGEDGSSVYIQSATKTGGTTTIVIADDDGHTSTLTINDGEDGDNGQPGAAGYVHAAWANSADGSVDFSTSISENKQYLGIYTDSTEADSQDYTKYSWSLIKGEDGEDGQDGKDGKDGQDGKDGRGISSTTITYGTSDSASTQPSSWGGSVPTSVAQGKWLWVKTVINYTDSTSNTTYQKSYVGTDGEDGTSVFVQSASKTGDTTTVVIADSDGNTSTLTIKDGEDGTDGAPGTPGANGLSSYVHTAWANSSDGKTDFSTTVSANKLYLGVYTDNTKADSTDPTKYSWSLIKGADGDDGRGISSTIITYGTSDSSTTQPSSWENSVPTSIAKGKWLWVKTVIKYTDNTSNTTYQKSYIGTDGEDGSSVFIQSATKADGVTTVVIADDDGHTSTLKINDGEDGTNGTPGAAGYVHTAWANSSDGKTDFSTTVSTNKKYLGIYTDNTKADSTDPTKYSWSLIKGADGSSVTVSKTEYQAGTSNTTAPTGTWSTSPVTVAEGSYLWTRVTYSDGKISYSVAKQGKSGTNGTNGKDGKDGTNGKDGTSVTVSSIAYSYQRSTSGTTIPTGTWSSTPVAPTTTEFAWTKTTTTYSDGSTAITYTVGGKTGEDGEDGKTLYGTCATAAGTADKVVVCTDATELYAGLTVMVTFTNANTGAALTLNVNSLGKKNVYFSGANTSSTNLFLWGAGASVTFTYNGSVWIPIGHPCTYYGACSTAAGAAAKASTISQAVICKGTMVSLQMTYANTVANATLNISSTGAKSIYANGATLAADSPYNWIAGATASFTFDGQYWRLGDTSASSKAASAKTTADNALISANGKNKVYHQKEEPTGGTYNVGDTWFDTDNGYRMYSYNGSKWVQEVFGGTAIANLAITNAKIANGTIESAKIANLDGGKITAGSITTDKLNANDINASGTLTIGALNTSDPATASAILNSEIEIGGRNLLRYTSTPCTDLSKINASTNNWSSVTEDGIACVKGANNNTMHLFGNQQSGTIYQTELLKANTTYTYSAWIKVNKAASFHSQSYGHFQVNNSASTASDKTHEDVASKRIYEPSTIAANTWTKIRLTFTTNDLAGSTFGIYPAFNNGADVVIYMYGWKLEEGNVATDWSPAPEDVADKSNAVKRTQRIYYRTSSATAPTTAYLPTAWVTETGNKWAANSTTKANWSTKVTPIANGTGASVTKYLYLYTCEQREMADGTLAYTNVLLDDSTTVINGGNIITGTVTANKLNANDINASGSLTIGALNTSDSATASAILNSEIEVGGRNLLVNTGGDSALDVHTVDVTKALVSNLYYVMTNGEITLYPSSATTNEKYYRFLPHEVRNLHGLEAGATYTLSCYLKGSIASNARVCIRTQWRTDGNWTGGLEEDIPLTSSYVKCSWTETLPENATAYYMSFQIYDLTTDTILQVKNLKLEKGTIATDWTPAPEDTDAAIMDVSQMIKIDTRQREFTTANWKTYGAFGHLENWTTGTSYDNSKIHIGDTAYLTGTVTDGVGGTATIIGTVTAVYGTNGSAGITMVSKQLIFGGDSVDNAAKTATNYLHFDATNGLDVGYTGTNAKTNISGSGVKIYAADNTNHADVNANGMQVFKSGSQVASFGEKVILGSSESADRRVVIAADASTSIKIPVFSPADVLNGSGTDPIGHVLLDGSGLRVDGVAGSVVIQPIDNTASLNPGGVGAGYEIASILDPGNNKLLDMLSQGLCCYVPAGFAKGATAPYVQATGSASSQASGTGVTQVTLATKSLSYEPNSDFTISSGGIKVNNAGVYRITGSVYITPVSGTTRVGAFVKVGTSFSAASEVMGTMYNVSSDKTQRGTQVGPKLVNITAAGQIVFLAARTMGTAGTVVPNHGSTYLLIERIS